jgi:hypothetical protein
MVDAELHGVGVDAHLVRLRATACAGVARAHGADEHHGRHDDVHGIRCRRNGTALIPSGSPRGARGVGMAWLAVRISTLAGVAAGGDGEMAARRRVERRADVHAVPPNVRALRAGLLDEPGRKPARWRAVRQLVGAPWGAAPLTAALRAHPMVARLLIAVGATERMRIQTVGALVSAL